MFCVWCIIFYGDLMKTFIISQNDASQRLDKFLTKACPMLPQSAMYKYIRKKRIKINGKRAEISSKLEIGDRIDLYINDDFFGTKTDSFSLCDIEPNLDIVYEDNNILIVNKPFGMVVHENEGEKKNTLINHIKAYLIRSEKYDPKVENSFAPALCNRIDRNTAGLVIAAKNAEALRIINEKIKNHEIKKTYLCITTGIPKPAEGKIENYIWKDSSKNRVYIKKEKTQGAKPAVTLYKTLEAKDGLALLQVELITGRTHQIRAHMAHIGCPLLGDGKYGKNEVNRRFKATHQALCAYSLRFSDDKATILSYLSGKCIELKNATEIIGWAKK